MAGSGLGSTTSRLAREPPLPLAWSTFGSSGPRHRQGCPGTVIPDACSPSGTLCHPGRAAFHSVLSHLTPGRRHERKSDTQKGGTKGDTSTLQVNYMVPTPGRGPRSSEHQCPVGRYFHKRIRGISLVLWGSHTREVTRLSAVPWTCSHCWPASCGPTDQPSRPLRHARRAHSTHIT